MSVYVNCIRYGLYFGDQHPKKGQDEIEFKPNADAITYEEFYRKMVDVLERYKEQSSLEVKNTLGPYQMEQEISTETWRASFKTGRSFLKVI